MVDLENYIPSELQWDIKLIGRKPYRLRKKKVTLTHKRNNIKKEKEKNKLTSRWAKHVASKNVITPIQSRNDFILISLQFGRCFPQSVFPRRLSRNANS